jgi:hypothetical protein
LSKGTSSAPSVDRPVVLVGSGRCGSTLLQSILNTNPEFLIWGEHNALLRPIADAYYGARHERFPDQLNLNAKDRMKRLRNRNHWPAWDNLCGQAEFQDRFRAFIRSLFADPDGQAVRWGFKEIRYAQSSKDQTLRFMFDCFPQMRLIVLIRAPEATIFSVLSHWVFEDRRRGNIAADELDREILRTAHGWNVQYMHLHSLCEAQPANCLRVHYEDLRSSKLYERLGKFLGASPFDYKSLVGKVKDASNKTDPTAHLILRRMKHLQPEIENATRGARAAYGYSSDMSSRNISAAV